MKDEFLTCALAMAICEAHEHPERSQELLSHCYDEAKMYLLRNSEMLHMFTELMAKIDEARAHVISTEFDTF